MFNLEKVNEILSYRKWTEEHKVDAPTEWWDVLPKIFAKDIDRTIEYLRNCNEEDLAVLAEQFEDIAAESQSKKFITFIEDLQIKYPNIDMKQDIEWAKQVIEQ